MGWHTPCIVRLFAGNQSALLNQHSDPPQLAMSTYSSSTTHPNRRTVKDVMNAVGGVLKDVAPITPRRVRPYILVSGTLLKNEAFQNALDWMLNGAGISLG